jgi:hypothetical protein
VKIRMLSIMAGPDGNADAGQVIERPDDVARGLIEAGYAEEVDEKADSDKAGK